MHSVDVRKDGIIAVNGSIEIEGLIENASIKPIHILVLAISFATATIDGLDNQVIGFLAPSISASLHIPLSQFGAIFSAGTFGTLAGAVSLGRLGDRIGRKNGLTLYTLVFAIFTLATAWAHTATELSILRFVGGLGLGGAMPVFLTLVSEYAPRSHKALATGMLWCGYPTGGMLGSAIGSQIVPQFGWHAMFIAGGGIALVLAVIQWTLLPESPTFLALRGSSRHTLLKILDRLYPGADLRQSTFVSRQPSSQRAHIREVFADGRFIPTLLLWIPLFLTFFLTSFFVLWSPGLFKTSGMPISAAALMVALFNFSTIPSQAATGYLVDRIGPFRLMPFGFAALACVIFGMGFFLDAVAVSATGMVLVGLLMGPAISGLLFLPTSIYPSRCRATGVGLAVGVGRSGQVVGTLLIGGMFSLGYTPQSIFLSVALAPIVAACSVIALGSIILRSPTQ